MGSPTLWMERNRPALQKTLSIEYIFLLFAKYAKVYKLYLFL